MEFVEAVNPHYAFPIVGVIVCALLVFAFGFKSPGQPPSFDIIVDEERKVPKKRKGKDNQKSKPQQNGKVASNVTIKVDSVAPPTKVKASTEKSTTKSEAKSKPQQNGKVSSNVKVDNVAPPAKVKVSTEKPITKSEAKSNKKSRAQQNSKQSESGSKKEVQILEDGNEAGWVQLLSKKERKNRKKDDVAVVDSEVIKSSVAKASDVPLAENSTEKGYQNGTQLIQKDEKDVDMNDVAVEKQADDDFKLPSKAQRTPKKKKSKKDESELNVEANGNKQVLPPKATDALKEKDNVVANEITMYSPLVESIPVSEPAGKELLQIQENVDVEDDVKNKAKKKKGKKKNKENPTSENSVSDRVNVIVPLTEKGNKVESEAVIKKEIIIETKHISQDLNGEMNGNEPKEIVPTKGSSNVAFDELGDMSEEKPQKKKKKARRDH